MVNFAVTRSEGGNISLSTINMVAGLFLAGSLVACASGDSSPFPSSITFIGSQQFSFAAKGTWAFPANTASGESGRLDWLNHYLAQRGRCPSGYQLIRRTPEHLELSPKRSVEDQQQRSVTYIGQCR
jgi:hypothetical protein